MRIEKITLNETRQVRLVAYIQDVGGEFSHLSKRPAMVVLPGGGYAMCSEREAEPVALAYLKAGYQAFVLYYSVKEHAAWPNPLTDYDQAVDLIKSKADQWHVNDDKIACVGFSAGGHLAACVASSARNKPVAALLGYPAIDLLTNFPDASQSVDDATAPCFVFGTRTDRLVTPDNMLTFLSALTKHGISYESHIYSYGPHGFSTAESWVQLPESGISSRVSGWVADSIGWLKEIIGDFSADGMTAPQIGRRVDGNADETLSVNCTLGYLMSKDNVRDIINPIVESIRDHVPGTQKLGLPGEEDDLASQIAKAFSLREVLAVLKISQEQIDRIDSQLKLIANN